VPISEVSRAAVSGADERCSLHYATEAQYARERLGLSRSSLVARRALAARLEAMPTLTEALGSAKIGVEAALQLVRIVTVRTEQAWVQRAQRRTVKHLRKEVAAALVAVRHSGETDCPPPEEAELEAFAELESAVLSGRICQPSAPAVLRRHVLAPEGPERRAWQRMLASLATFLGSGGIQMSANAPRSRVGRVVSKLRVARSTFRWWRGLEAQARRFLSGMSRLRFLCLCIWHAWRHWRWCRPGLRRHLSARRLSLPEPGMQSARRHSAPPALSLSRRRRRARERGHGVQLVPSVRHPRGPHPR
jgi:hypothetical protein